MLKVCGLVLSTSRFMSLAHTTNQRRGILDSFGALVVQHFHEEGKNVAPPLRDCTEPRPVLYLGTNKKQNISIYIYIF